MQESAARKTGRGHCLGSAWYTKEALDETWRVPQEPLHPLPLDRWPLGEIESCWSVNAHSRSPAVYADGCEAAGAFAQRLFLIQGKAGSGQGETEERTGTLVRRVAVVVQVQAPSRCRGRNFVLPSPRMAVIAQASTGGQCRPGSKAIPCLAACSCQPAPAR